MIFSLLSIIQCVVAITGTSLCDNPMYSCDNIDIKLFYGDWYQIGSTKDTRKGYQKNCQCLTSSFNQDPETISITNVCKLADGTNEIAYGSADILNASEMKIQYVSENTDDQSSFKSQIKEYFKGFSRKVNFAILNVWVDENGEYIHALVVEPLNRFLPSSFQQYSQSIWVLSRTLEIDSIDLQEILEYASGAGYNPVASLFEASTAGCRSFVL
jgi:lipocalin